MKSILLCCRSFAGIKTRALFKPNRKSTRFSSQVQWFDLKT
jgi:hypothetical protein